MKDLLKNRLMVAAVVFAAFASATQAGVIPINNGDFESSSGAGTPAGWNLGFGTIGVYSPTTTQYNPLPGSIGNNVAYLQGQGSVINQDLSTQVTVGQQYILSIDVGNRADAIFGIANISLTDGTGRNLTFNAGSSSMVAPSSGSFNTWTLNFTAQAGTTGDLNIYLVNGASGTTEVDFDNVTLMTAVPEPVNMGLGIFGIVAATALAGRRLLAVRKSPKLV